MKIIVTARELLDKNVWGEFCDLTGFNHYAVNEGMDDSHTFEISVDVAKELRLI